MGFLIEEGAALIWRGLMVMQALDKLMRQVEWGPTDYLIVDTPPGTGDTHLSLVQNLPISGKFKIILIVLRIALLILGVVLITTPQNASLQVTKRGGVMYKKLNVPLIGIIENMSHVVCPSCTSKIEMFGNGIKDLSRDLNCKIMEQFPIQKEISVNCDKGIPIVINEPDSSISQQYRNVAKDIVDFLEADTNKIINKA